jgi:DNA/RNA-binding domain of Phe-tRNA-synthetase-like protein
MLNHEPLRLADGEYRFACLVWDNEPLPSGQLVALAAEGQAKRYSPSARRSGS